MKLYKMKCDKCGNSRFWTEIIQKGISQEIKYADGQIIEETTKYDRDEGVVICDKCGKEFEDYDM